MTNSHSASPKVNEKAASKPSNVAVREGSETSFETAWPSLALLEEKRPMPGSVAIRQQNFLALQNRIGNAAIQRMLVQREGESESPPAASPESETGEGEGSGGTTEEERRFAFQAGVSTPVPANATIGEGQATLDIGGAHVVILPDATSEDEALAGGAITTGSLSSWAVPGYDTGDDGNVSSIHEIPAPEIRIQTTYGPGSAASDTSEYGVGTREEDTGEETTLGFHEGAHGSTTIDYLRSTPLPTFGGTVGMTVDEWNTAVSEYQTAMQGWDSALQAHQIASVDCVGQQADFCEAEEEAHEHAH